MSSILEHIKIKKHAYKVIAGVAAVSLCVGWLSFRNNAYAITVNGEVVAIVKEKEEAKAALEKVVKHIKTQKGVDIALKDTLAVEPVNSSAKEINSTDQVVKALNHAVSYDVEAYEILVDGKVQAIVESKEIAEEVLAKVAKKHLPEKAEVKLAETSKKEAKAQPNEKVQTVDEKVQTNEKAQTIDKKVLPEEKAATIDKQVSTPQQEKVSAEQEKKAGTGQEANVEIPIDKQKAAIKTEISENAEPLQVADGLPQKEVSSEIKVESVEKNETEPKEEVKEQKADKEKGQKIQRELKIFDFNEEVVIKSTYVKAEDIITPEKALENLTSSQKEVVEYELKEGENIWDIAVEHGTTMAHILKINPQIKDETKMQIGEKIRLEVPDPILSISTTEEATYKELIPAEIKYVEFSDLYKDETKVYQKGHDGLNEIKVAVHKINGIEESRELISSKTLKEPKIQVVAYGTKEKPKVKHITGGGEDVTPSDGGTFMHPLNGGGSMSSEYGYRWGSFHRGIDIAAPAGTPIYAAAGGEVIYSGYNNGGYGKLIIIDHGNGYQTYYGHCSSLYVQVGQNVSKGQNIAGVGSTGDSTGNHVHFEIRSGGTPINPTSYVY